MRCGAVLDATGMYRYSLSRAWDASLPAIAFIMLNPSTADHRFDDPTIRRSIGFARSWGYGSLIVSNLFAYRTCSPAELRRTAAPVGPENDAHLRRVYRRAAAVLAAWGTHGSLHQRDRQVMELLGLLAPSGPHSRRRPPLLCLGTTVHGYPRHPLYVRKSATPVCFAPLP